MGGRLFYARKAHALTEKDTIVLADFTNSTGEAVFDGTLRQGLSAQLEQSPFLNLLSDERIAHTLALMERPKDLPLSYQVASEVCKRTASTATIQGSIATLGSQYVLGLKAVNCKNGDPLADLQVTANGKERVLKALGDAAAQLRQRLGESLSSVQKYDTPSEDVTTSSLEALNAYSLGIKARHEQGDFAAIPFFRRAIELDPRFAMAHMRLGLEYANIGEANQAVLSYAKAFALRDRVSTKEGYEISSGYYDNALGDLQKSAEVFQLWSQTYPQDPVPLDHLANDYIWLGQYPQALEVLTAGKKLIRAGYYNYANVVVTYISLNRLQEAQREIQQAWERKLEPGPGYAALYFIDFLEANVSGMEADVAWASGKTGSDAAFLNMQSDTQAYAGHRREAWAFSERAVAAARREKENEVAASYLANAALREAEFGNFARAVETARSALSLAPSRDVKTLVALALARAGSADGAATLAHELAQGNPSHTILNNYWLPTILAAIELDRNHPTQAIETLRVAEPYDLGSPPQIGPATLYPAYVRGLAYLRLHQAAGAAREFQKLLDHRGCVLNFPLGSLAHLELARVHVLSGDTNAARSAYQDFFTLWKDADPDIPILKQARAEYAKLQ